MNNNDPFAPLVDEPRENPFETPPQVNDFYFYSGTGESKDERPRFGRVRTKEHLFDSVRFFFGKIGFFAAIFLVATSYWYVVVQSLVCAGRFLAPIYWIVGAIASAPLPLLACQLALRLAKTGSIRRRVDSTEPPYFSANYLGSGVLGAAFLVGLGALGFWTALFILNGRFFAGIGWWGVLTTFAATAFFLTVLSFFPYFLAEEKINVFKAFWRSLRSLFRVAPAYFFEGATALFGVGIVAAIFGRSESTFFFCIAVGIGAVCSVFLAPATVAYLLATGRRLYCEKEEATKENDER